MKHTFLVKAVAVIDYDTEGRTIHILHPNGFEEWKEYYDDGKKVHRKDSEGKEEWWEYFGWVEHDHFVDSAGREVWNDRYGEKTYYHDSCGNETWYINDRKKIYCYSKDSEGKQEWWEYDKDGNLTYHRKEMSNENPYDEVEWLEERFVYNFEQNKVQHVKETRWNSVEKIAKREEMWTDETLDYDLVKDLKLSLENSNDEDDEEACLIQYLGNRSVWYEREAWENGKRKRCLVFRKITLKEWLEEKFDAVKESRANKKLKKLGLLAQSGSGKAMFAISEMYVNHKLNPKNGNSLQLAHEWNQKSAEAGYPPAMAKEAWFHICGWKKPSSLEKAFSYLQAAVNSGYKKANMQLYECYRYGWGTEPNYEKARDCLKATAKFDKRARATLKSFTKDKVSKEEGEAYLVRIRGFYN